MSTPAPAAPPDESTRAPIGPRYLWLVVFGAAIGIPAALVAALFLALVHALDGWLWHDLPHALGHRAPPWYLVLALPVAGAGIVILARLLLPGDGGHEPLRGLDPAPTPVANAAGVVVAALGTLGFGAVLGPEAPVIGLGSAVGLLLTSRLRRGPAETRLMASAGQFSAISALFGGPVVAGVLLVEGGLRLGAALLPALLPGLVAAAIGYLIFVGFGTWGGLDTAGLTVPDLPAYHGTHLYDLIIAVAVGVLAALIASLTTRAATRVAGLRARTGMPLLLVAGGLAVGGIAEIGGLIGANSQDILFSGQHSISALVSADSTRIVAVLFAGKLLAYAISLGCGFRGGPIFPAIFLGIALASFPVVWFHTSPTLAVAIGAAAGMAAQTKLLLTPLMLATLLVGGAAGVDTLPAAVIAAAAAWLVTSRLSSRA